MIDPAIAAWRSGQLTEDEHKTLGKTWIALKNNVPARIGGSPLSDARLQSMLAAVRAILVRHSFIDTGGQDWEEGPGAFLGE